MPVEDRDQVAEREHLSHIEHAIETRRPETSLGAQRGYARQARCRDQERAVRRRAVEHLREAESRGVRRHAVAAELRVSMRTLGRWHKRYETDGLRAVRRGRPTQRSSGVNRNGVIATMKLFGAETGVETMRWLFPAMARGEVADILRRYRGHDRRAKASMRKSLECRLRWLRDGAVWSMDHTEPPGTVDGQRAVVLSVGDLGSGVQLLWEAQPGARADLVADSLDRLFEEHGAPLIMKSDNGSAFIAGAVGAMLEKWGVIPLWNPPRTPGYNGTRESDIRWAKARTENVAWQRGGKGDWNREDLASARELTNRLPKRPTRGARARGEVFSTRARISPEERAWFHTAVAEERVMERELRGLATAMALPRREQANIERQAISRALVARGCLSVRKRRVTPALKSFFQDRIW